MTRTEAKRLRGIIETSSQSLDDKTASTVPTFYPKLKGDGTLVKAGTKIQWNGSVKKAAVDLWDTKENNPDNAPTLWASIDYRDGYRLIPDIITVTTAFAKNECGWWRGKLYKSLVDANVYNPEQYAANWEEVK